MAAHSPASSPRLPSPPPIPEDQVGPGPMSPGFSLFEDHGKPQTTMDTGASRRIRPGTKAEDMAEGPPLIDLQDITSAFPLTEHLKALHNSHTHPSDSHTTTPITPSLAHHLTQPPPNTSREIWLYELARLLTQKTNAIIVALFADTPPCSSSTCPEMRASEWQYLCAVHDPPKNCSAIDYCCHTLDWAATTLTSSKTFPSRLGLGAGGSGSGTGNDKLLQQQLKEITNIFRRVYRIYAHAWFQHREVFWRVEGKTGLYVLFKTVCEEYGMILAENYTIPAEAEGLGPSQPEEEGRGEGGEGVGVRAGPTVLRRDYDGSDAAGLGLSNDTPAASQQQPAGNTILAAGDTTKRHRHTRSDLADRSSSVTTVIQEEPEAEEEEEEEEQPELESSETSPLERQAMGLRDFAEALVQPGRHGEDGGEGEVRGEEEREEDEEAEEAGEGEDGPPDLLPGVGIARSGTLKPTRSAEEGAEEAEEPAVEVEKADEEGEAVEAGSTTAVESQEADGEVEGKGEEERVDSVEPSSSEAPAAEGQEAGKSVGD